ncbi:MAG: hypothetical protein EZS28_034286 [Streblomastix strix]|uniref:Mariner Mos1 transposase n=1 Tax=Streblomastix strix TaxID=222440 RepID=A0A5J4UIA3_9EUKA|nr:MAG: hypothetical protein EZS28_034286 [Streblomastix strix]
MEFAEIMLKQLKNICRDQFSRYVTLDETWVFLANSHDSSFIRKSDPIPSRKRKQIGDAKIMFNVCFGDQIYYIHKLLCGDSMNAETFISKISSKIQFCQNSTFPYSLDLSPCDYFLFGVLKRSLKGKFFKSDSEAMTAVSAILEKISKQQLIRALEYMEVSITYFSATILNNVA